MSVKQKSEGKCTKVLQGLPTLKTAVGSSFQFLVIQVIGNSEMNL